MTMRETGTMIIWLLVCLTMANYSFGLVVRLIGS